MKKNVWMVALLSLLFLGGCNQNKNQTVSTVSMGTTTTTTETTTQKAAPSTEKNSASSSTVTAASTESTSIDHEETPSSDEAFPYQVPLSALSSETTFYFDGANVPATITIDKEKPSLSFDNGENAVARFGEYRLSFQRIPTKEIRVFSADDSGIRNVAVNTMLTTGSLLSGESRTQTENGTFYLFYNNQGGISLATPNYAGNVASENTDVLLEVLTN